MKKLFYTILAIAAVSFVNTSCTDEFLEEEMVATITQDYFDTPAGMDALIYGCYDGIRFLTDYYYGLNWFTKYSEEAGFDKMNQSGWNYTGGMALGADGIMGSYNNQIFGTYPCINNCLRAIEGIDSGKLGGQYENAAYANKMKSKALFIKTYMYYLLHILYGDIYIKPTATKGIDGVFYFPRSTSEELYKMMIGDLRFAYENLPGYEAYKDVTGRQHITKGAAAHLLSRLYLERAQAAGWGKYRASDGGPDYENLDTSHLGMLYKGNVNTDLDSCIFYATKVIEDPNYALTPDFNDVFRDGDYSLENSTDVIIAVSQGEGLNAGRFGHRWAYAYSGRYTGAQWGVPNRTWIYGSSSGQAGVSDWGYDVYTNKLNDSRFEKTFMVELQAATEGTKNALGDYHAYDSSSNNTVRWNAAGAAHFNANLAAEHDYQGRPYAGDAAEGKRKIGTGDLGIAYVENSRETAIPLEDANAFPFVIAPRWIKDGDNYYYHADTRNDNFQSTFNAGLEKGYNAPVSYIKKYMDRNRTAVNSSYGGRDVPMFRVSETYLIRAEAYGRRGDWASALADINAVRHRAAYKAGENRAYTMAKIYNKYVYNNQLPTEETVWPYTVTEDTVDEMTVDKDYVTSVTAESAAEDYPPVPDWWEDGDDIWNFVNFINNEKVRELHAEFIPFMSQHQAGIQYERMVWHNQMASPFEATAYTASKVWPAAAANVVTASSEINYQGATGKGKGYYEPHNTFRPFYYNYLNKLTDENGSPLNAQQGALKPYQNPGYDY